MTKGKKGFQKGHKPLGGEDTQFKKGHKTNLGKKWKVKDTSKMKVPKKTKNIKRGPMKKETKEKIRKKLIGKNVRENGSNWKGGVSKLNKIIRDRYEYKKWVSECMTRDDWTCRTCSKRGGKLQVHHRKSFATILKEHKIKTPEGAIKCKELWNIDNGVTLCLDCHKQTDSYLKNIGKKEVENNGYWRRIQKKRKRKS